MTPSTTTRRDVASLTVSWQAVEWVLDYSPEQHARRLVLVELATHAKPDGTDTHPSIDTIMRRTKYERSTVCDALAALKRHGSIVAEGRSSWGTTRYRIIMNLGAINSPDCGEPVHSSSEPSLLHLFGETARDGSGPKSRTPDLIAELEREADGDADALERELWS